MAILNLIPFLLVFLLTTSTTLAAPGDTLYIRGNHVNVRAAPTLKAPILQQVHYGQVVIEIGRQGKWVKVSLSRSKVKMGWIYGTLVKQVPRREGSRFVRYAIVSAGKPLLLKSHHFSLESTCESPYSQSTTTLSS